MKPYISKLFNLGYLNHKGGLALDVGAGDGKDADSFKELGYIVEQFDIKNGHDVLDFDFKKDTYDFINANNILPFVTDKKNVELSLQKMAAALKKGGILHFTLFGENDPWNIKLAMSFFSFTKANSLVDSLGLKCLSRSEEEFMGKTMAGEDKYWHKLEYILKKV